MASVMVGVKRVFHRAYQSHGESLFAKAGVARSLLGTTVLRQRIKDAAMLHLVLNYILLEVWSFIAPLLPAKYLHNVRYLPDTDFVSLGSRRFPTNCFQLAEQFCPEGMAAVLRQTLLRFPDREAATKWETEITDIYREYFGYFFDGFSTKIVPVNVSMIPDKNKYFADQKDILVAVVAVVEFLFQHYSKKSQVVS
ncbi:uncharacterized protein LOC142765835 [Rhipicephalus microplus]|uniref:uncharacterized protein LOC142765835 n=1 Tax=Rhipicephalus microplus TaxID=6941 RepID=UPI003F6C2219